MCVQEPTEVKEGIGSPRIGVIGTMWVLARILYQNSKFS